MFDENSKNWQESDINVDSLWLIGERDKSGKHRNLYHGNFIPQIPDQLLRRYTRENDVVIDLFAGSGTTLFECEKLRRRFIGFDLNLEVIDFVNSQMRGAATKYFLHNGDVVNQENTAARVAESLAAFDRQSADFLIAHPPYLDIVKFTNLPEDLSQIADIKIFLPKFMQALANALPFLARNKYFAVVIGDVYKKSEVVPLGFYVMDAIKRRFKVKLKGVVVKNIEGNRGKLGQQNIWKYRALHSDYFIFKHEYIFVFKKDE
ncbi:hypothetical protein FACS1894139_07050 [Planctomycetales bacterium]|nr:hypothetical protein FACS1894107_04910 [Planctomycetales bacterium]GHT04619.1 hypothetical protein FACS1894139_07050 [Planctomycetales bacterium]